MTRTFLPAVAMAAVALMSGPSAASTQPQQPYFLSNLYVVEDDAAYRTPGVEPAASPRTGIVVEGVDYSGGAGLPWASPDVEAAVRAGCPAGRVAMQVPDGILLPGTTGDIVMTRFVLVATTSEALLVRRFPVIAGSDGCQLRRGFRIAIDRAFTSDAMTTTFSFGDGSAPPMISTTVAEEGRNGLLDNMLVSLIDLDEVRLHQPAGGTHPAPRIGGIQDPIVCFDMSDPGRPGHECYLDIAGPWRGLNVVAHRDEGAGNQEGMRVERLRREAIDGRLFQWDRAITLAL